MSAAELGVIVVTYNSGREVLDCLESLLSASRAVGVPLRIVVVDNASSDETVTGIFDWAQGQSDYLPPDSLPFSITAVPKPLSVIEAMPDVAQSREGHVHLVKSTTNIGFAGGVNLGLKYLAGFSDIRHFWVLNPDSVVPPASLQALHDELGDNPSYGLMGGRVCYMDTPDRIQIDGGTVNFHTGVTGNLNLGRAASETPVPDAAELDFIMGASMVASRDFYERVGPMCEDYFLYYEEVDWAMRRGDLPLRYCDGLVVYHHAGSSIGSPGWGRSASPFSLYFKHRGRIRFLRRFRPASLVIGFAYSLAYAARLFLRDRSLSEAWAVLAGSFGLRPPRQIRDRLTWPVWKRRDQAGRRDTSGSQGE
ncbi:glycosyltransferase family 2 protein [Qingshengfaniella alkalisoli]|uniref:Glycosyltransferase family 2 protein n=1 Tax=Qingshengfaniella alkalisoli TaxID=2599296 RepID=A0A5B8IBU7_9RHOB|nr:glycosyltransferase family 2 protein [Qingshengfaniella alkalisoli]QDY70956.1 glycosyltransferase family 2 protein [Qingshengfaniella alkalisoli]